MVFNMPMNISEIRRRNIQQLIETKYDGNRSYFARVLEKPDNQIQRIFIQTKNGRNVSSSFARFIEKKTNLKKDCLDLLVPHLSEEDQRIVDTHFNMEASDFKENIAALISDLSPQGVKELWTVYIGSLASDQSS